MVFSLKQKLGALVFDVPRYTYFLYLVLSSGGWIKVKNRADRLVEVADHDGVACNGEWTSELYLPKIFPHFTSPLVKAALEYAPIRLTETRAKELRPDISIIIGHKGQVRFPLLLQTLRSVAAQKNIRLECVVVEQDLKPSIQEHLPDWVKYVFMPMATKKSPYSRAKAFNIGAQHASAQNFIFHDNDILMPENYAHETYHHLQRGFEFVNLKRFIFYLTKQATERFLSAPAITPKIEFESVMQNALGGGSVGASKQAFYDIGGFDERFSGWGGEDNEFWERAQTRKVWNYANLPLMHLWHPSQPEKVDYNNAPTKRLYARLSNITPEERIRNLTRKD